MFCVTVSKIYKIYSGIIKLLNEVEVIKIGLLPPSPEPKSMPSKKPTGSKLRANNDTFQLIPSNLDIIRCSTQFRTLSHLAVTPYMYRS